MSDISGRDEQDILEALRESEEKFRLFVTASSDTLYKMSADWREMYNLQGMDFLTDTEEPSGSWLEKYIPEDERPRVLAAIDEAIRTRSTFELEHRVIRRDGTIGWTFSRAIPVLDSRGEITEWFGAASDITNRKRAEEELRKLALIVENSPNFIGIASPEGRVLFVNPAGRALVGLESDEQVRANHILDYVAGEEGERAHNQMLTAVFRDGRWEGETFFRHFKTGTLIPMLHHVFFITEPASNRRIALATISLDNTESKRAEDALRKAQAELEREVEKRTLELSVANTQLRAEIEERAEAEEALRLAEEKYHSIFENAVEGIYQSTPEGQFISVNPAHARMLGYDSSEELIAELTDIERHYVEPGRRAEFKRQLAEHGVVKGFESEVYRRDGSKVWISENVRAVRDDDGRLLYYEGTVEDITERKRTEEALKQSEQDYRGLFEQAHDAILVLNPEREIVLDVNERACEIYGFSHSEFIGMSLEAISPDVSRGKLRIQETLQKGDYLNFETVQYRKDGSEMFLEINASVVNYKGQRAILSINRDITERVLAEQHRLRQTQHAALRAEVSSILVEADNPLQRTLHGCAQALVKHLDAAFARIWLLNEEENVLELQASAGMYTHLDGAHSRVPVGSLKIGLIAQTRQPHLKNDVRRDPLISDQDWAEREMMVAFAGYPLLVEQRLVGVIAMFARRPLAEDTLDALASVSDAIAQGVERKRVQEALRDSEDRYRDLVEHSHALICTHDLEGRILSVNLWAEKTLGYGLNDLLKKNIRDLLAPEFRGEFHEYLAAIQKNGSTRGFAQVQTATGERRIWEYNNTLRTHGVAAPIVRGMAHDITERRRAEEERAYLLRRLVTAQEDERYRIARELHDQIGQYLAAVMLRVKSLKDESQSAPHLVTDVAKLQELINEFSREMRGLALELRPPALDDLGLGTAISNYLERWSERSEIAVDFHSNGLLNRRFPPAVEMVLYRVIQEALNNILKHSQARHVSLLLEYRRAHLQAVLDDDGCGFNVEETLSAPVYERGLGLTGMRERIESVGGTLDIESSPDVGTTLVARIPVIETKGIERN